LDPNWFYSSLAQSAAAIVGLLGGLLAAGLIRRREEAAAARVDLLTRAGRHFAAYRALVGPRTRLLNWWDLTVRPQLEAGMEVVTVPDLVSVTDAGIRGPLYLKMSHADQTQLTALIAQSRTIVRDFSDAGLSKLFLGRPDARFGEALAASANFQHDLETTWRPDDRQLFAIVKGGTELISHYSMTFAEFALASQQARLATPTRAYWRVLIMLAFIAVSCVVLPLAQLSAHSASDRIVFLLCFAAGMAGVLGLAAWELADLGRMLSISVQDVLLLQPFAPAPMGSRNADMHR
jgi:hypothetical protein